MAFVNDLAIQSRGFRIVNESMDKPGDFAGLVFATDAADEGTSEPLRHVCQDRTR